jgi:TonB family protein
MKSFGVALLACVTFSGCTRTNYTSQADNTPRANNYTLQTRAETGYGGRTYVVAEVLDTSKKVVKTYRNEMVPGMGARYMSEGSDEPKIELRINYDLEGRGANVSFDVSNKHGERFVPRPLPPGFDRADPEQGILPPRVAHRVAPIFPDIAAHQRYLPSIYVDAMIRADGTVESVQVLNPDPKHDGLDEAAALAVRLWRFEPPRQNVAAVQVVEFKR